MLIICRCAIFALCIGEVSASLVDVLTKVKTFHSAGLELFNGLAEELKAKKEDSASKKAEAFGNDWLSILGVQKGLTGLAKDFTLNYLGRESYHNHNGPLVDALKQAGRKDAETTQRVPQISACHSESP
ncbi:unnamed protein product [Symbiodinium natans]|uniref:Uncharacterized protein n=1 Tax=Symbiodinium natans TaxID=878477 RepID=A0A812HGZ3_9DINO|nr:unnamed protein product [Symbiodinium natans]